MSEFRKLYWDTTCFICFLNDSQLEKDRQYICADIMEHVDKGNVEIWTSSITLAEVIRPKDRFVPTPFPQWVAPILGKFPAAEIELRRLWDFFVRRTMPTRMLTDEELAGIRNLLTPRRVKTVVVDDRIANAAVEISRTCGLKPMDAIHAASAMTLHRNNRIEVLQYWDKDYERVGHLVPVETPERISAQQGFKEVIQPIGGVSARLFSFDKEE
ncbi:MAG TPA: PIN domain-containing protein [Candidatus Angelobacter sp.]|nr:PIN domain-containing protein [Candidatus Angelobacter sp.]